jgi:hypothetical protein
LRRNLFLDTSALERYYLPLDTHHSGIVMPSRSPTVEAKGRLTLAQLASYDDVLTDALVDRVGIPRLDMRHQTNETCRLGFGQQFAKTEANIFQFEGYRTILSHPFFCTPPSWLAT